jgi:hypothetical protein
VITESLLLVAALSISVDSGKHPYDVALDFCRDKGGLAQYTSNGDAVRFSCGNDISNIITIQR